MKSLRDFFLRRVSVYVGKAPGRIQPAPGRWAVILFPLETAACFCGIAGLIRIKRGPDADGTAEIIQTLRRITGEIETRGAPAIRSERPDARETDLSEETARLNRITASFKRNRPFTDLYFDAALTEQIVEVGGRLQRIAEAESRHLAANRESLSANRREAVSAHIEGLKDAAWCLKKEVGENLKKMRDLLPPSPVPHTAETIGLFKGINAVLNSIDRIEVRGRDSAGFTVMISINEEDYRRFRQQIEAGGQLSDLTERSTHEILGDGTIRIHKRTVNDREDPVYSVAFTYKFAAEIGRLGDNVSYLRRRIRTDGVLGHLLSLSYFDPTILAHTRWASVGAITVPNCHPTDNVAGGDNLDDKTIIQTVLNGDIDNHAELKAELESKGIRISGEITTDTKLIPLLIEAHYKECGDITESFRRTVCAFSGSHAVAMVTNLMPATLFLAQKGSGQALFVGLAEDYFMPASEVYGFVEETDRYVKMDGETEIDGENGVTQGQIFTISADGSGAPDVSAIEAMYYDGTKAELTESDVQTTAITTRDIDRQAYPHYFLKEITEAPVSVEKTLMQRCDFDTGLLDETAVPRDLAKAIGAGELRRIFFIGQGTAGVAAAACADIMRCYLNDPAIHVEAKKSSELSGFGLETTEHPNGMSDTLVVAVSQSGTTTDTNRAVDMVREQGARTLAVVNRRDSHITFRVDGVLYTSTGRDIEMSVASTKAFYAQVVAGALLSLHIAHLTGKRDRRFVEAELAELDALPGKMRQVLSTRDDIESSACRLAARKTYWAAVGSGPNKAAADEIRIKLSELCYKTISSDYVEDKKHIDLSSEPLIIVCAAGSRESVLGDIVKDTAIFQAHKADIIVIAEEGETRFTPYAQDVFYVPAVPEHLAVILNTLVGHIWGYFAALSINEGSRFLFDFRESLSKTIDQFAEQGLDVYETVLEKDFREAVARFYYDFRRRKSENPLPTFLGMDTVADLTLLMKYLTGRLPVSDFEIDFEQKGTAGAMLNLFFNRLNLAIEQLARPIDAIKHQAKTVTVGTSRITEKTTGLLFDALTQSGFQISQLTTRNVIVLKNLQRIVAEIAGATIYQIRGLNLLGEPTEETTIHVIRKTGSSFEMVSRVEHDRQLKGTKQIIVREGNVYIGKGRKDHRSILIIPILSDNPGRANRIEYLLLWNVRIKTEIPRPDKIKALGGKLNRIQNIVWENGIAWKDEYLDLLETTDLFGLSAERIGDAVVTAVAGGASAAKIGGVNVIHPPSQ